MDRLDQLDDRREGRCAQYHNHQRYIILLIWVNIAAVTLLLGFIFGVVIAVLVD